MTNEELRALDAEIHRKVFGKEPRRDVYGYHGNGPAQPEYTKGIAAAFAVLELAEYWELVKTSDGRVRCHINLGGDAVGNWEGDTAAEAIGRAALNAVAATGVSA